MKIKFAMKDDTGFGASWGDDPWYGSGGSGSQIMNAITTGGGARSYSPPPPMAPRKWEIVLVGSPVTWTAKGDFDWLHGGQVLRFRTENDEYVEVRPGYMPLWIKEIK